MLSSRWPLSESAANSASTVARPFWGSLPLFETLGYAVFMELGNPLNIGLPQILFRTFGRSAQVESSKRMGISLSFSEISGAFACKRI